MLMPERFYVIYTLEYTLPDLGSITRQRELHDYQWARFQLMLCRRYPVYLTTAAAPIYV